MSLKTQCLIQIKAQFAILFFSYTQLTLQAFDLCYPYEFLFCFVLYDLYGFEMCQIFKNGMMLKIGNQKTTRFVPGLA